MSWVIGSWDGMIGGTILVDEYLIEIEDAMPDIFIDDTEFILEIEESSFDIEIDDIDYILEVCDE